MGCKLNLFFSTHVQCAKNISPIYGSEEFPKIRTNVNTLQQLLTLVGSIKLTIIRNQDNFDPKL